MMSRNDRAARELYASQGADWLIDKAASAHTEELLAVVLAHVEPGDRVADLCCGYGRLTLPLLQRGFDVTGVDISDVLLARGLSDVRAAGIRRNPFLVGDMKHLPLASGRFDVALCVWASVNFAVSEAEQLQALQEMRRVLAPRGRVLIECPLHETPGPVQTVTVGHISYEYCPLTVAQIGELAARASFSRCDVSAVDVGGRPRAVALLQR